MRNDFTREALQVLAGRNDFRNDGGGNSVSLTWLQVGNHLLLTSEASDHTRSVSCLCHPRMQRGVIVHRRLKNSTALYQPWQDGH